MYPLRHLDNFAIDTVLPGRLSTQIATAAEQQSAVTEEINRSMVQIRHMVDERVKSGQANPMTRNLRLPGEVQDGIYKECVAAETRITSKQSPASMLAKMVRMHFLGRNSKRDSPCEPTCVWSP